MSASWGPIRTYLPSLKQNLGPFPCPRLVPAPGRAVQVTYYGQRGRQFLRVRQNRCSDPNALSRSVPSNRLVPLGEFLLESVAVSTEINHFAPLGFSSQRVSEYCSLLGELDHAEGEAWAKGYARGSAVQKGRTDGH